MWNLTRWTLSINRQTESSIYGRLTPPRACSLSLFTFSDTEDEEREEKKTLWWWWRAMPTQSSDNSDSKGVWESVSLTVFNNAALNWCKKTQLALSSHGLMGRLWFRLGHSELRLVCARILKATHKCGSAMKAFFWFHMQVITVLLHARARATIGYCTVPFKASRLELRPATSGSKDLYLLTLLSNKCTHAHIRRGGRKKHIVIISHRTKVVSLISARMNGQKSTQLKSEKISEKVTQSIMRHFRQ